MKKILLSNQTKTTLRLMAKELGIENLNKSTHEIIVKKLLECSYNELTTSLKKVK